MGYCCRAGFAIAAQLSSSRVLLTGHVTEAHPQNSMTANEMELMEVLYDTPKILDDDIRWEHEGGGRFCMKARVVSDASGEILEIKGQKWQKGYSFVLMYKNNIIRCWDFNDHHPGINGGHKHKYPYDEYQEDDPYSVNDVSTTNVNQGLIDFLDECKIEYDHADIQEVPKVDQYD